MFIRLSYQFLITVFTLLLLISCKKDSAIIEDAAPSENRFSSADISVYLKNNNLSVIWDTLNNINSAGNTYSIHNVNFYLSNINLKKDDGTFYSSNKIFYIDPSYGSKSIIHLDSIPKGNYTEIVYLIGIDSIRNIDFGLGTTIDNLNMAWPTAMGGGYHFIKMEGHYLDTSHTSQGYAIHIGKNENLIKIKITQHLSQQNASHQYSLLFNINEVFMNPYIYNLNIDNNYTMSDSVAMRKIKTNIQDAFTIIQNN